MDKEIQMDDLQALDPLEALRARLNGDFGMDDEAAMASAICQDPRITLTDDKIIAVVCDAMDEDLEPQRCMERLITREQRQASQDDRVSRRRLRNRLAGASLAL